MNESINQQGVSRTAHPPLKIKNLSLLQNIIVEGTWNTT